MNMRTSFGTPFRAALGAAALALATLGCLQSEDKGGGGTGFSSEIEIDVLNTTPPQGGEPGTLVTRSFEYECYNGSLTTDTVVEEQRYIISDGKLYVWKEGACHVDIVLTGSSSAIVGTWKATSLTTSAEVPATYRDEDCEDEEDYYEDEYYDDEYPGDGMGFDDALKNVSVTYTISSTKIKGKLSGDVCFASMYAETYTDIFDDIKVTSSSCGSTKLRNDATGATATLSAALNDKNLEVKFKSGDSTCVMRIPFDLSNDPPVCSEGDDEYQEMLAYGNCVMGSGFFGDPGYDYEDYAAGKAAARDPAAAAHAAFKKRLKSLSAGTR